MVDFELSFDVPEGLAPELPVLPLRSGVLLPGLATPFTVGRARSLAALEAVGADQFLIVAVQKDDEGDPSRENLLPVGTLARVVRVVGQNRNARSVLIQGIARVSMEITEGEPCLMARHTVLKQAFGDSPEAEAMKSLLRSSLEALRGLSEDLPLLSVAAQVQDESMLIDLLAAVLETEDEWKKDILLTLDPVARTEKVLKKLESVRELLSAQKTIHERVMSDVQGQNREVLLRKQLEAIKKELGEDEDDDLAQLRARLDERELPAEVRASVDKEFRRLERLGRTTPERSVAVDWLTWVADLPWNEESGADINLDTIEEKLNETHAGLEEVKRQVLEYMAVRKLAGRGRADVLLLVGPPGVGKTSIAQAIADATGRKLLRVALGGVRDEAELRGHRRTYVGARPGRIVEGFRRAATSDPVVLLDEVDKLGRGWQGDPSAALLEILDPEQNSAFTDHYLELPFDLSKALFIATANDLAEISAPLRDRMQVLQIDGYTNEDKRIIARGHVWKKLAENTGLAPEDLEIEDDALDDLIAGWTREAGVRQLQRVLGRLFRAAAVKKVKAELDRPLRVGKSDLKDLLGRRKFTDETHEGPHRPGVAVGLAWTPVGGDVLYIEAALVPGSGKLVVTGQLGEVMKESAQAALTYVLAQSKTLGIREDVLRERDVHLHVPAGATPKDGPSAGITMFAALASLLSGQKLRSDVAMTGEATLRGRVLPVGGIKSKVLAAHARGFQRVVLPRKNEEDFDELPDAVKKALEVVFVSEMSEVLPAVLAPPPRGARPPEERGYIGYSVA